MCMSNTFSPWFEQATLIRDVEAPAAEVRVGDRFESQLVPGLEVEALSDRDGRIVKGSCAGRGVGEVIRCRFASVWTRLPSLDDVQGSPWVKDSNGVKVVRLPRLDANAADVAREVVERREPVGTPLWPAGRRPDTAIAKDMEAVNAAYQESEAQRREVEAIKERMRPGVGVMNLGAPFVGGWDRNVRR